MSTSPGMRNSAPLPASAASGRLRSSAIRELLSLTDRPELISLAGGLPAPETFPALELRAVVDELLADRAETVLQYSATEGHPGLRAWVAGRAGVTPDHVVITSGAQQALELVVRATVDPGTPVALADPGYVGMIQALQLAGADLVGVPATDEAFDVGHLADRLAAGLRPALVYVVASFHNPTGATLGACLLYTSDAADE